MVGDERRVSRRWGAMQYLRSCPRKGTSPHISRGWLQGEAVTLSIRPRAQILISLVLLFSFVSFEVYKPQVLADVRGSVERWPLRGVPHFL